MENPEDRAFQSALATLSTWRSTLVLSDAEKEWLTDRTLRRYIVARNNDAQAALAMLEKSRKWRSRAIQFPLSCKLCDNDYTSHCFWNVGLLSDGSLCVYNCSARGHATDVEPVLNHTFSYLEHGLSKSPTTRWTFMIDFKAFGFVHTMQARLGISFASTFADHFPETLSKLVLINPPTLFSLLRSAIAPFADARTMSKIVEVHGTPDEVMEQMARLDIFVPLAGSEASTSPTTPTDKAQWRHDKVACWLHTTLGMEGAPGSLPPFPEESAHFIPHSPDWNGVPGLTSSKGR